MPEAFFVSWAWSATEERSTARTAWAILPSHSPRWKCTQFGWGLFLVCRWTLYISIWRKAESGVRKYQPATHSTRPQWYHGDNTLDNTNTRAFTPKDSKFSNQDYISFSLFSQPTTISRVTNTHIKCLLSEWFVWELKTKWYKQTSRQQIQLNTKYML